MKIRTFIVDAFTETPFRGNPAGVCLLENPLEVSIMQRIANELKHSETAFIQREPNSAGQLPIRYFTPTVEVPFCGHATMAASKVVLEKLDQAHVNFLTGHKLLLSAQKSEAGIVMKFPLYETMSYEVNKDMLHALSLPRVQDAQYSKDLNMVLLRVADKNTLLAIQPHFRELALSHPGLNVLVITAPSTDQQFDFYSRSFCPWIGIDEDPVTGAAHTMLAPYWQKILGRKKMKAFQCSERGGYLDLVIKNQDELEVTSQAHIILEGEISI
jgi:PhzF family phenazine biosynthesis protein